ncbi:MAG TPA: glycosyltransferase [Actinomycetota bacterium]|nr:glycosyltransferase [Actinomycetota bacterium]
MRPARILHLIDSLGMGGAERGLAATLGHLDPGRFASEVAFLWGPDLLATAIHRLGIPVHRVRAPRGPGALRAIEPVRRLLVRRRIDLIHTSVVWASIVGRIAGHRAGVKVVSHVTNVDPRGFQRAELSRAVGLKARAVAWLDEWTGARYVDRFVAITEAVREHPIRGGSWDRSKIVVVRRGQDLHALAAAARGDPDPPIADPGSPTILAVGRLSEQKGHRVLLEAMPKVLAELPRARLSVVGDGHLRGRLQKQAEPLGDRVAFLGIRRDVPALLARCDAFCFPSLWEGQGNALLEAMAVGAPIVATSIPAVTETVRDGETAVLVPPGDPAALADGLLRVLREPGESSVMAVKARLDATRFDIRQTTRDLEAVYDDVLRPTSSA